MTTGILTISKWPSLFSANNTVQGFCSNPYAFVRDKVSTAAAGVLTCVYKRCATNDSVSTLRTKVLEAFIHKSTKGTRDAVVCASEDACRKYVDKKLGETPWKGMLADFASGTVRWLINSTHEKAVSVFSERTQEAIQPLLLEVEALALSFPLQKMISRAIDCGMVIVAESILSISTNFMTGDAVAAKTEHLRNTFFLGTVVFLAHDAYKIYKIYNKYDQSEMKRLETQLSTLLPTITKKQSKALAFLLGDSIRTTISQTLGLRYLAAFDKILRSPDDKQIKMIENIAQALSV